MVSEDDEDHHLYYKLVAKLGDQYFSIWDSSVEYKIG